MNCPSKDKGNIADALNIHKHNFAAELVVRMILHFPQTHLILRSLHLATNELKSLTH